MIKSIEPVLDDPNHPLTFHIDWEVNMKCNLDCSYCASHDNSTDNPSLEDCLKTVDFLLKYTDLHMKAKPVGQRHAIINLFGGEALYHPNIVELLTEIRKRHEQYKPTWTLAVASITNAVVKPKIWHRIVDLVDYFTISYHTENTDEQQEMFKQNLLIIKEKNKGHHCAILMHPKYFDKNLEMIEFCKANGVNYVPRQLDHGSSTYEYKTEQIIWFDALYKKKSTKPVDTGIDTTKKKEEKTSMTEIGRACCGGVQMHTNQDYSSKVYFIPGNTFPGWSCSVDKFFIFVKQITKELFFNKDCRMRYDGTVGPFGYLDDAEKILKDLEDNIKNNTMPTITCAKKRCWCGLCAPKAETPEIYQNIMKKYQL